MAASPELRTIVGRMIEAGESEQDIAAVIQRMTAPTPPVSGQLEPPEVSPVTRGVRAGLEALKSGAQLAWRASGVPGFVREGPIGAVKDQGGIVRDLLQAQFDQFKKARQASTVSEAIGHAGAGVLPVVGPMAARMGEQIGSGQTPEMLGELAAGVLTAGAAKAAPVVANVARAHRASRAANRAAALGARVEGDLMMAIPPTKTAPYTPDDLRTVKPYVNAQHEAAPITSVNAFRDALDSAIGEVESRVSSFVEAFPEAKLNPLEKVQQHLSRAFDDNPRGDALKKGLSELDDLPLNRDLTLPELDGVRLQLNAENKAILKRNNYDVATARKADPAFAAREAASAAIRDVLYDYLESRGVKGVRELRRDEGALIKVRNAAERQTFTGGRPVAGTNEAGLVRRALAQMVEKGSTATGAAVGGVPGAVVGSHVGETLGNVVRGSRQTRDALVARAFGVADKARPTYPTIPVRPPTAGALPPASTIAVRPQSGPVVGPSGTPVTVPIPERLGLPEGRQPIVPPAAPDPSGRIPATLPENYLREQAFLDDAVGPKKVAAADVVPAERNFILRWLADDLRGISYQPSSRMRGVQALDESMSIRAGDRPSTYAPRVAGTPTQEMFHAAGIKGTRAEIAERLDTYVRTGKGSPKIAAVADALLEAWDGRAFDFNLISDETIGRLGIRRRDLRSPVSTPSPDDMPSVYERFFPRERLDDADEFSFPDESQ